MENIETFNSETIEETEQIESIISELGHEDNIEEVATTEQGQIVENSVENESAQSTETMIDYSETLTLICTEIQTINYLMTVMVFLQLFIWVESKVNHIVRSVSNKWKV